MKLFRYLLPLMLMALFSGAVFATTGGDCNEANTGTCEAGYSCQKSGITYTCVKTETAISNQLCNIKNLIVGIIPTIALIMFLLAGLVYAAGQTFGAEMKAKAQGWAMSLLVGGIVGIVIAVIAPLLVDTFIGMGSFGARAC